ncbi:Ppx/GppA phosphatase family protein [Paenibacillus piri]|uniref:Ppx/GppA family phosphatase n=1 Tax=Paenibacillus piri TaxID=2547395 RepID=A0A4V2ZUF2_9BACL|nr:Ppx/GppA phosphatase family protein [Paenibacillus piri]TDG00725.1 Ppx/GppA family phosphatase [Paenibacillus piri]
MPNSRRIGIIDIGSNSIRLVIYEIHASGAHRVIAEFKQSARLSQRIGADNRLPATDIQAIIAILTQFKQICGVHEVMLADIRAAATAAIRNAANSQEIIGALRLETGIAVELLSGEDEARIGFLGMIRSLDIQDGILVDIGGGSTEVTVFRARKRLKSVSFPFGAVNTSRKYSSSGQCSEEQLKSIRHMVQQAVAQEPWLRMHPGLPLVGLGGTIRTLSKIHQKKHKYSLPVTHNYSIAAAPMDELMKWLASLPADKRKKVDGLSKDRFDIIIPGMTILQALFQATGASGYTISGAGLRDGLFHAAYTPAQSPETSPLEQSTRNLINLHCMAPAAHLQQVTDHAAALFDALQSVHGLDGRNRQCLLTAAMLHRIGTAIDYYHYTKHGFYMIAHSRIDGLTHRETIVCAAVASYKTKNKSQQVYLRHKDILQETDLDRIAKLGTILQLAKALDVTETQAVASVTAVAAAASSRLLLRAAIKHDPSNEISAVDSIQKEFNKIWGLKPVIQTL